MKLHSSHLRLYVFNHKILFLFLFVIVFTILYITSRNYGTLNFKYQLIGAQLNSYRSVRIFYSENSEFTLKNSKLIVLKRMYDGSTNINISIPSNKIKSIRLDPKPNSGEILIKNLQFIKKSGFNENKKIIDLSLITPQKTIDFEIIEKNKQSVLLLATGNTPMVILTQNLSIPSTLNYFFLFKLSLLALIITVLLYSLLYGFKSKYLHGEEIIVTSILLLYSAYLFLDRNRSLDHNILILIPMISILSVLRQGIKLYYKPLKYIIIILFTLSAIIVINYLFNSNNHIHSYPPFILDITLFMFIVIGFIQTKNFNQNFYRYMLVTLILILASFTILLQYGIVELHELLMLEKYQISLTQNNQKIYEFWILYLMWGTISFLQFNKKHLVLILSIFILSGILFQSGYSDSAPLAFVVSIIFYFLFSFIKFRLNHLKLIPIFIVLYIILTPWIAEVYASLAYLHPRLGGREAIFTIYSNLIKENFLFGYGFNSCIDLIPENYLSPELLEKYADNLRIKSCGPHSLGLLIWLNFGAIGALSFSTLIYILMKKFIIITYNQSNQAALLSLIVSFSIINTFSLGTWYAYGLLSYAFFLAMLFLSLNQNKITK